VAQKAPPPQLLWAMVCIRPLQDTQFRFLLDSGHGGTALLDAPDLLPVGIDFASHG